MVPLPSASTSLIISWSSSSVGFWSNDRMTVANSSTVMHPIVDSRIWTQLAYKQLTTTCIWCWLEFCQSTEELNWITHTHFLKIIDRYRYCKNEEVTKLAHSPSPSLSNKQKASLKSTICSSLRTSVMVCFCLSNFNQKKEIETKRKRREAERGKRE